jgi:hypothetical protein
MPRFIIEDVRYQAEDIRIHWESANTELAQPIILPDGFAHADFVALHQQLEDIDEAITHQENVRSIAKRDMELKGEPLAAVVPRFNLTVRALLPESTYVDVLERAPGPNEGRAKRIGAMERTARLWEVVNLNNPPYPGFTPPLVLADGTTRAQFVADLDAYRLATGENGEATQDERMARAARRDLAEQAWRRMVEYRLVAQALLMAHGSLLHILPRISPRRKRKKKASENESPVEP